MGKFIGWDIMPAAAAKCTNCGMQKENKKGCCNDEHKTLQLQKDHIISGNLEVAHNYFSYSTKPVSAFILPSFFNNAEVTQSINIPPLIQPVAAFIFHCVMRV